MDTALIVITLGSFLASFVNAAFATGGVYIMLLASIWVLPISVAVPLQSAFAAGSLSARVYYFWQYIYWPIAGTFVAGCCIGVYFGTRAFVALPEAILSIALGTVLLTLIWMPNRRRALDNRRTFFFVGVVHSFFGALFGVGGVLQPFILRTSLKKMQITGTLAVCLISLDVMKATGYVSIGFSYWDYYPHILCATLSGVLGTWIGKRVTYHVSEEGFRTMFRILVSLIAVRLIYKGIVS